MHVKRAVSCRRGATVVEVAFVLPVTLLLIVGLMIGCLGVFRSNQLAELARAAARYASTHGSQREREGHGATTRQNIIDATITPRAASLTPLIVQIDVVRPDGSAVAWDDSSWAGPPMRDKNVTLVGDHGLSKMNRVRVTVSYAWLPEAFFAGPITLTSTSEQVMCY